MALLLRTLSSQPATSLRAASTSSIVGSPSASGMCSLLRRAQQPFVQRGPSGDLHRPLFRSRCCVAMPRSEQQLPHAAAEASPVAAQLQEETVATKLAQGGAADGAAAPPADTTTSAALLHDTAPDAAPLVSADASQSVADVPSESAPGEVAFVSLPARLPEAWSAFLSAIHELGHFDDGSQKATVIRNKTDVKAALLSFGRARADLLFTLPRSDLACLAGAALLPRSPPGLVDRKLRNAYVRLQASCGPGSAPSSDAGGQASLQDMLRVTWDWAGADEDTAEQAVPGICFAIHTLLTATLRGAALPPSPDAAAAAAKAVTPSAGAMAGIQAGRAEKRSGLVEASKSVREDRLRSLLRSMPSNTTAEPKPGDWFCGTCRCLNFSKRQECYRCGAPADLKSHSAVRDSDLSRGGALASAPRPPVSLPMASSSTTSAPDAPPRLLYSQRSQPRNLTGAQMAAPAVSSAAAAVADGDGDSTGSLNSSSETPLAVHSSSSSSSVGATEAGEPVVAKRAPLPRVPLDGTLVNFAGRTGRDSRPPPRQMLAMPARVGAAAAAAAPAAWSRRDMPPVGQPSRRGRAATGDDNDDGDDEFEMADEEDESPKGRRRHLDEFYDNRGAPGPSEGRGRDAKASRGGRELYASSSSSERGGGGSSRDSGSAGWSRGGERSGERGGDSWSGQRESRLVEPRDGLVGREGRPYERSDRSSSSGAEDGRGGGGRGAAYGQERRPYEDSRWGDRSAGKGGRGGEDHWQAASGAARRVGQRDGGDGVGGRDRAAGAAREGGRGSQSDDSSSAGRPDRRELFGRGDRDQEGGGDASSSAGPGGRGAREGGGRVLTRRGGRSEGLRPVQDLEGPDGVVTESRRSMLRRRAATMPEFMEPANSSDRTDWKGPPGRGAAPERKSRF